MDVQKEEIRNGVEVYTEAKEGVDSVVEGEQPMGQRFC